ncbi:dihydrofolate reductase family protein [Herbidospora mongoliensis]|uniref:dihydrofolate reductase family protein n=1 Tax=Herbidospora mongoliensis TaxID=688067 RepID=UPI00082C7B33|nr:dihydrofolate reductase family protein [Herbidospora mongoliensis]
MTFTAAAFIGTSLDGFIARPDGDLTWLTTRGEQAGDLGYTDFIRDIDTVALGRVTYETVLGFGAWPYEGKQVAVLSTTLPASDERVTVYRSFDDLVAGLTPHSKRVYVDGGRLIQTFLREGRLDELTVTRAPVLIGEGMPLFGSLHGDVALTHRLTVAYESGFVQSTYTR